MKEYPKHLYAPAPIGQTVTVHNLAQEEAVMNGTAKFEVVFAAGSFGQSGNTYTVVVPEEK